MPFLVSNKPDYQRYLLADDPGAGKTIMAGLLIKELIVRGDVRRCLIYTPGSLAGQWQDELWLKFQTHFDIHTNGRPNGWQTAVAVSSPQLCKFRRINTVPFSAWSRNNML